MLLWSDTHGDAERREEVGHRGAVYKQTDVYMREVDKNTIFLLFIHTHTLSQKQNLTIVAGLWSHGQEGTERQPLIAVIPVPACPAPPSPLSCCGPSDHPLV